MQGGLVGLLEWCAFSGGGGGLPPSLFASMIRWIHPCPWVPASRRYQDQLSDRRRMALLASIGAVEADEADQNERGGEEGRAGSANGDSSSDWGSSEDEVDNFDHGL